MAIHAEQTTPQTTPSTLTLQNKPKLHAQVSLIIFITLFFQQFSLIYTVNMKLRKKHLLINFDFCSLTQKK